MKPQAILAAAVALAACCPALASADVVDPVPPGWPCPPGTTAYATHSGPRCGIWPCGQGCPADYECRSVQFCITTEEYWKQGQTRMQRDVVGGVCDATSKCPGRCEAKQVCVSTKAAADLSRTPVPVPVPADAAGPAAAAAPAPAAKGAFCAAGGSGLTSVLLLGLLLPAGLRRRKPVL
ncbi:MAG TPA: hypothetical protein VGK67_05225 [Myxococcales bacterium]|jgi:hypothetical protein